MKSLNFGKWPRYSPACRRDVDRLLRAGGSLSAYRSNPSHPYGPRERSWAWKLERKAEQLFGLRHVIACNSGTMALQAGLFALDLPKGSTIVTTPYTFSATVAAIIHAGHTPVFADVDPETFCLDRKSVSKVPLKLGMEATLSVDLFGRVADHDGYVYSGPIIEDACQAVGAKRDHRWAGDFGSVAAFSFNGMKNIPAGEAGAMTTNDDDLAIRARRFVSHSENWGGLDVGLNGRLNEITACVAYHGLIAVKKNNAWRRLLAVELWRQLKDEPRVKVLTLKEIEGHALYVYPMLLRGGVDRARFVRRLRKLGVEASEGYIRPHLGHYPAFKDAVRIPMPVVEELSESTLVLLLQVRPPATIGHMCHLAAAVRTALGGMKPSAHRADLGRVEAAAF